MWFTVLWSCSYSPPPAHATALSNARTALLARDFEALSPAVVPLTATGSGLSAMDERRWEQVRAAAAAVGEARVPSAATAAYGTLIGTCASCHERVVPPDVEGGHGQVFRTLEEGVIWRDPARRLAASQRVGQLPELGVSRLRLTQLAERMADSDDAVDQGRDFGEMLQECLRCHGLRNDL